ncbi:MAG: ANTAR domain-containing protein [Acetatifactor sp.]|nr:ANTAR domain-containing protein [Acetatifactor sp.]
MSLEQRRYSILVASAVENFNSALSELLPESAYFPVHIVSSVSIARRTLAERAFDFVIVNSPLPDDPGVRFAIDACTSKGTVVLLLVKSEAYVSVYDKVVDHGVFTLSKPLSKQSILQALSWMASARERLRKIEKKTLSIEEKMEEIRLVNRAKWLLISELKMDEPHAHRYIEKQAMDMCIPKRQVAEEIIRTYS